jgi:hypothetical protein
MKPGSRRWTTAENTELDRLLNAGKEAAEIAVALISANLKRLAKSAQDRLAYLARQAIKAEFEREPAEPAAKAKDK